MTTTWARARSIAAAVLARLWPPSGAHHAIPEDTEAPAAVEPLRPPEPPEWARSVPPQSMTTVQLRVADLVRPYHSVPRQREGQHRG